MAAISAASYVAHIPAFGDGAAGAQTVHALDPEIWRTTTSYGSVWFASAAAPAALT